jgi:hypothetical protein
MTCAQYAGARVLEACDEVAGPDWERHLESCESCSAVVDDFREVRRLYAETRPVRLNTRAKRAVLSMIRRERNRGRLRSAIASVAGVAAAVLLLLGVGRTPTVAAAAEPPPAGSMIDNGIVEVRARVADLESGDRAFIDAALDDLKERIGVLSWDAENM